MSWRPYLDLQHLQSPHFAERGISRYATELTRALLRSGAPVAALGFNPHLPLPADLPPEIAASPRLTWNTANALRRAADEGPTVYHLLAPFEPSDHVSSWLPGNVIRSGVPLAVTVHDLIHASMGLLDRGSRDERFYRIRTRLLSHADLLLANSEQTRRDVIEQLGVDPDRITVVGAGCSEYFRPPTPEESPEDLLSGALLELRRPFLLTVSAWDLRKNTELLIDAFALLPADVRNSLQLVVAGKLPPETIDRWRARVHELGLAPDNVIFTGFVPDTVLRALYQRTELFVEPSRYEGFGFPVVEAARCGAAAVVSDAPGLSDLIPWQPAKFDPSDPGGLAVLVERALTDTGFHARLREVASAVAQQHTWDDVAARTVAAYERLTPSARRRRLRRQLRVALVGPFPPARSGIADYNAEVAVHLGEHCELDCFVDACDWNHPAIDHEAPARSNQAVGARRPTGATARWLPARAFGRRVDAARYDAVVYTIGDSWFHHDTLGLARNFPGIVWFHDLDLTGLYVPYAHRLMAGDPAAGAAVIRQALAGYGERGPDLPIGLTDLRWATPEPYRRAGIRFTLELARAATTSIVPSRRALGVLELDAGPAELLAPVDVLPLAVPDRRRVRASADPPPTKPVVVALGRLGFDTKRPDALIDAIAVVAKARAVRLAFVGQIHPAIDDRLARQVTELGLTDVVEITGYVPDSKYRRYVDGAAAAVQLGGYEHGEGSAAVADALGRGVPVITDIASCRELPPGTVDVLDPDATPGEIARAILRVLDHPEHASTLRRAAVAYAGAWSFEDVAARLLDIIDAAKDRRWLEPQSA
jgi:glycosyltransferase involved in cell wall biosynthesis